MRVISSFYGILIKMYFGDHVPPHFHAEYAEFSAQISIMDFGIIEGNLPPKALGDLLLNGPACIRMNLWRIGNH
ncbi:DUF4160 domain-containing protein [Terrimonas alba]|uniref:DUF4160 domain-containing protein n=1 Tax=Terrimonas alba TaxID=3349636 RepID=UPI0035F4D7E2